MITNFQKNLLEYFSLNCSKESGNKKRVQDEHPPGEAKKKESD